MAGVKGRCGGHRPGAGRKPQPRPLAPEAVQLLDEIRQALQVQNGRLQRLERQTEREPFLRRLTAIERALNLVEKPQAPCHTRRWPLGAE